jgi:hypothetical protein
LSVRSIKDALKKPNDAQEKLLHLSNQIPSFGGPIFGPVLFFLGNFIFSLFDARDKQGDNDTANAIAFGIWYGVIILVAIFGLGTIGVENPFAIENVFGRGGIQSHHKTGDSMRMVPVFVSAIWHGLTRTKEYLVVPDETSETFQKRKEDIPFAYFESPYLTVWLGQRHISFRKWIEAARSFPEAKKPGIVDRLSLGWMPRICAFVTPMFLVCILCGLATSICYFTPMVIKLFASN